MTHTLSTFMSLLWPRGNSQPGSLAARPACGLTDSVVGLQARLAHGTPVAELTALAGSAGRHGVLPDSWAWSDPRGNEIVVTVRRRVVVSWQVSRHEPADQLQSLSAAA
jgi:hypothetical protein